MNDITINPERTSRGAQELQREELVMDRPAVEQRQAVQFQSANGLQCPYCGTVNEPDAIFCA